jgi:acyl carrier protein phosphodiesterase
MNYLAHSFLSNNDPGLLVGNFIADHIAGNNFQNYPEKVIEGIILHRKIDTFTDSHPKFKESKRFFYKNYEKYSGILVDIYFDHLLAKNFAKISPVPLKIYCKNVYTIYKKNIEIFPESSAGFLKYVLKNNIYFAYSTIEGIETVLFHLSHRIKHGILLNHSLPDFEKNKVQLKKNFDDFFNDAKKEFL